ncbi:RNA-directed DNA polymerase [Anaeromyxobacter oryzae]|uniref:RNA-directed DNA polymerase n=1 Tax=Anaeromyxobacter oryzae TaxID=2918170 RepID=UPI0020BF1664|nr:RNA-directed DNA polymerase [Anaeromyxobacter oryzae]
MKLRPLAHVSLIDQVAATALMMCLADRIETRQGDPRGPVNRLHERKRVVSYGNRLFCDKRKDKLRHRWGSGKIYRGYYHDYRRFLARTDLVAERASAQGNGRVVIIHTDLQQFFDRVAPRLIERNLARVAKESDDDGFYELAGRILSWQWDNRDRNEVDRYAKNTKLDSFSVVALPQGLVAAGFFSNVALLEVDDLLQQAFSTEIRPGIHLEDACRYVDDYRLVVRAGANVSLDALERSAVEWLQELLNRCDTGLRIAKSKTKAVDVRGDERPAVQQSRKMSRIQGAVSGGFDVAGGEEILDAVQGLIRTQRRFSTEREGTPGWSLSPVADVRDATVARFAAGRFRTTYRSLRPLLTAREANAVRYENVETPADERRIAARSQAQLDDEARAFALGLIQSWVEDPANVRLLRIGLDIWPSPVALEKVLRLLRPHLKTVEHLSSAQRVAWYCLSELFRAGASETGYVEDLESLPEGVDVHEYRRLLRNEAEELECRRNVPWYVRRQLELFLAVARPDDKSVTLQDAIGVWSGRRNSTEAIATSLVIARRAFGKTNVAAEVARSTDASALLPYIAKRDPSLALEVVNARQELTKALPPHVREDLCLAARPRVRGKRTLASVVLDYGAEGPLRNELSMLLFAAGFLKALQADGSSAPVRPGDVYLPTVGEEPWNASGVEISTERTPGNPSLYDPPGWCPADEQWRFRLGYLLRFILTVERDFTRPAERQRRSKKPLGAYAVAAPSWLQRRYGWFNGQVAFGDDWLPISDWAEKMLAALLAWPGSKSSSEARYVRRGLGATLSAVEDRIGELLHKRGKSTNVLMLPLLARRPTRRDEKRPLRACVLQTVIPGADEFKPDDLSLSDPSTRRRHRNHLAAALAAVERLLELRETHRERGGRLDWLILPELAVHPNDVRTHLIPFARAHRTIILAGLAYQKLSPGQPLINSALWIIPEWTRRHGLQVRVCRQGKQHLAPDEERRNGRTQVLKGFRPCQWIVGYQWSSDRLDRPLWLTSSICYDATDLSLAADLRDVSDVFAIPAFNRDIKTFDQMSLALHYHMFQVVILANNGSYGGSNAHAPFREPYHSQVFHLHGQPQASAAFLEIDDISGYLRRKSRALSQSRDRPRARSNIAWKYPPAGVGGSEQPPRRITIRRA